MACHSPEGPNRVGLEGDRRRSRRALGPERRMGVSLDEVSGSRLPGIYTLAVAGDAIPIRAHALLCLQGFRGKGYSADFVERMGAVATELRRNPERLVRVLATPDTFCAVCPHGKDGCTLGGPGHEANIRLQDESVLERLGIEAGVEMPWHSLVRRLAVHIQGIDLGEICTTCPWLPLGWCAEGIDAAQHSLRSGAHGPA